ncbi:uncharacterized protein SCHCODRAFT_02640593 [Schizophyllum commune H4-8]|nr:uncharacterized protein SCHCODRAFT_02640593 [Schizophyllum commune H4-8]KAI5887049.1 hypothetical protein SCHCODRAFT_02640593 [Schizophyllum commune H4-8]
MSGAYAMPVLKETLDLYDIALLLNYERLIAEPRFHGYRLLDVVYDGQPFTDDRLAAHWDRTAYHEATAPAQKATGEPNFEFVSKLDEPRHGVSLLYHRGPASTKDQDSPATFVAANEQRAAAAGLTDPPFRFSDLQLSDRDRETLFYQSRSVGSSDSAVRLVQYFFALYPADTHLCVRTYDRTDPEYFTTISHRVVLQYVLRGLRMHTINSFLPDKSTVYHTPGQDGRARHSVLTFGNAPARWDNIRTVLNLASLEFGDAGRGVKGKGTFVLEPIKAYDARLDRVAEANELLMEEITVELPPLKEGDEEEMHLKAIAAKVKGRWDSRGKEPWCGHCGAPGPKVQAKCCSSARYCSRDHQVAAWPFHKLYCGQ